MVLQHTDSQSINNLYSKITGKKNPSDRIEIESDFQRGDDEFGVWSTREKVLYIDSLQQSFPTGLFTLVKDDNDTGANPWKVLDGGNRMRTIRDFKLDKFHNADGLKFSQLTESDKAIFDNIHIPCMWITIDIGDPPSTIAEMFARLNTSSKPLSQGELIKAHGSKNDCPIIELAKKLVGGCWSSSYEDDGELDRIRDKWYNIFGVISETQRNDTISVMLALAISAMTSNFKTFKMRYKRHLPYFTTEPLTSEQYDSICSKLSLFLNIWNQIPLDVIPAIKHGVPSYRYIAPTWHYVCENKVTCIQECSQIVRFYNVHYKTDSVRKTYEQMIGGTGEITLARIEKIQSYIESLG